MLNTYVNERREVPLWAIGVPAVGVPIMVALLALTAPRHEAMFDGTELGADTTEQVEHQAADHAFGFASDCVGRTSSS